jgi:hypothetical protein
MERWFVSIGGALLPPRRKNLSLETPGILTSEKKEEAYVCQ